MFGGMADLCMNACRHYLHYLINSVSNTGYLAENLTATHIKPASHVFVVQLAGKRGEIFQPNLLSEKNTDSSQLK